LKNRTLASSYCFMTRPLRKDAAERRVALLQAAAVEFAEKGFDVPLDAIAERAGVGRATLYRNFPDRTQLALSVFTKEVERLERSVAQRADEPGLFLWFIEALADLLLRNAGLSAALRDIPSQDALEPLRQTLVRIATEPLEKAQLAGEVRADLIPDDIRVIATLLGAGARLADESGRESASRLARDIVLNGLRSHA
jgi:AcrR family transcriptional regulator